MSIYVARVETRRYLQDTAVIL